MSDVESWGAGCIDDFIIDGKGEGLIPTLKEIQESYINKIYKYQDPKGFKPIREKETLPNYNTDETDDEDEEEGEEDSGPEKENKGVNYYQTVTKTEVKPPASIAPVARDSSGPAPVAPIRGPSPSAGRPSVAELVKTAVAEKAKTDTGKPVMDMQSGGVKPPSPAIAPMQPTGKKMEEVQVSSVEPAKEEKPQNVRTSLSLDELMMECETSTSREELSKIRKFFELTGLEPKIERVEGKIYGCVATARAKGAGGGLEASIETEEMYGNTPAEAIEAAVENLTDLINSENY